MGQKVHPTIFRIGVNRSWSSKWFTRHSFGEFLRQDLAIRKYLKKKFVGGGIASIQIARTGNVLTVTVHTSRPGVLIGRGGTGVEEMKKSIENVLPKLPAGKPGDKKQNVRVEIQEVDRPDLSAELVVQSVIEQLEKRIPFRRVLKQTVERVKRAGGKGVRVMIAGRLNGADIARREALHAGSIPLHTLRADIDYSRGNARTTYGVIGVKVWIYKGDVFGNVDTAESNVKAKR